jgi:type IV pilus assembly protein PilA
MKDLLKRARARAHPVEVEGEEAAEAGFTLIELMVVLLIIAILLAIAIPTFLGVSNTASDRAAQSNASNALTEGKALFEVNDAYATSANPPVAYTSGAFTSQAPEFTWQTTACPPATSNCVSFAVFDVASTGDSLGLALAVDSSKTDTCWYVYDLEATPPNGTAVGGGKFPTAGVWYGKSAMPTGGCVPLLDTAGVVFTTAGGQNYGNATKVS